MLWTKLLLPWERLSAKQCIAMEATLPTAMDLLYQLDSRWINEGVSIWHYSQTRDRACCTRRWDRGSSGSVCVAADFR